MRLGRLIKIAVVLAIVPVICLLTVADALACTGVYVGKGASADGTTIIARSNDVHPTIIPTIVKVYDRVENKPGRLFECTNGFSWPLPDTTYRYVCIPMTTFAQQYLGATNEDAAGAANECGLAISATVTGYICDEAAKADPAVETGICEFDMAGLVASSCATAREAIELLAKTIDECGTFEQNIIMATDANEAWYMEVYTGHQYAAVKMPEDCVAVFGNEFMLGDIEEGYEETITSPELYSLPQKKGFAQYNEEGHMDLFDTYAGRGRLADYANSRTWIGHKLLAPSSVGEYKTTDRYPLFYKPDSPVYVQDVMKIFRNRYEGTELDPRVNPSDKIRVIATETQAHVHILQRYPDMPDDLAVVNWCALSGAENTPFVPLFSKMTQVSAPYALDLEDDKFNPDSAFMVFKALKTLCSANPDLYTPAITKYWDKAEGRMIEDIPAVLQDAKDSKDAAKILTDYSMKCQNAAFEDASALYGDVLRNIMYNTDTLQYVLDYNALQYVPKEITPLKLSVNPGTIRTRYGY
ncbi:MAG: C69 family dipeptidase [Lachnospiraceae bacterium]|nr:C69 family dipeptidase [Lachnospiraceae bacterium]